ncbi:hypothetical protein L0Y46_00995 [bacterium]|nr:hypothetical protein [bacterium]MCI0680396.1 hypothetical protein [bacterium]
MARAFLFIKNAGVWVTLGKNFAIEDGHVSVNVDASDEEIIEFLLGP